MLFVKPSTHHHVISRHHVTITISYHSCHICCRHFSKLRVSFSYINPLCPGHQTETIQEYEYISNGYIFQRGMKAENDSSIISSNVRTLRTLYSPSCLRTNTHQSTKNITD